MMEAPGENVELFRLSPISSDFPSVTDFLLAVRRMSGNLGAYGGKGVPMSITSKFVKGLGWGLLALQGYQSLEAGRTEYKACMEY